MLKVKQHIAKICVVLILTGSVAMAQTPLPCTTPVALGAISLGPVPTAGAPYIATVRTTQDRITPDGGVVHSSVITYQARDSTGREWQRRSLGCRPGPDGVRRPVMQTLIYDPATGTTLSWVDNDPAKIIHVVRTPPVRLPPAKTDKRHIALGLRAAEQLGFRQQDLGSRKIAGVIAEGTRTEQTVPVRPGIDKPIHISQESWWIHKPVNLEMLSIHDNSMRGRTVTEVIQLKQGTPNRALFVPPTGWKKVDIKSAPSQ